MPKSFEVATPTQITHNNFISDTDTSPGDHSGENNGNDTSINVPLIAGLASGLGTLFLLFIIFAIYAFFDRRRRVALTHGIPGQFDDEALLQQEEEALEHMDDFSRQLYLRAKQFQNANPPLSLDTDISLSQFLAIQEKGVSAWEFMVDFPHANCFVQARTEIEFYDATCCVQTNLPLPNQNETYYWEAKMYEKPGETIVSVGLTTKPYPTFRLPGHHKYSVAYDSLGLRRLNQPFSAPSFFPPIQQGDVIGVGYKPQSGDIFFTRNGKKFHEQIRGMKMNLFPTIGADGPCKVHVNFGQAGFVFIEANVKKWGLAPATGSLAPPPPYGVESDSVLLESGTSSIASASDLTSRENDFSDNEFSSQYSPPPPSFRRVISSDNSIIDDITLLSLRGQSVESLRFENDEETAGTPLLRNLSHSPPPSYTSDINTDSEHEDENNNIDHGNREENVNDVHSQEDSVAGSENYIAENALSSMITQLSTEPESSEPIQNIPRDSSRKVASSIICGSVESQSFKSTSSTPDI